MGKVHLTYRIKGESEPSGAAFCGNNQRQYKYGLKAVLAKEFRSVPASDRCTHCERIYLEQRNKVRKGKGLPPVSTPFEGLEAAH